MADCVQIAKEIRTELKKTFPTVKFSVRSERYSGGSSVRISWVDLPSQKAVEAITDKYARVRRCEHSGDILSGGNMFVSASAEITPEFRAEVESLMPEWAINDHRQYYRAFNEAVEQLHIKQFGNAEQLEEGSQEETTKITHDKGLIITYTINEQFNGIEITFSDKPSKEAREELLGRN